MQSACLLCPSNFNGIEVMTVKKLREMRLQGMLAAEFGSFRHPYFRPIPFCSHVQNESTSRRVDSAGSILRRLAGQTGETA